MKRRLLLLIIAVCFLASNTALADGAYFTGGEFSELAETTHQQAILVFNDDSTTLILQTGYAGDGSSFSWVVPTEQPISQEDVSVHEPGLFDELHYITSPKLVTFMHGCGAVGCASDSSNTGSSSTVSVYDAFKVDNYDITVLSADQSADLSGWLQDNDYHVPDGAEMVFHNYVSRGFYFIAVKFEGAASTGNGGDGGGTAERAKPLAMRFEGSMTTFPLLISSLSTKKEVEVLLYTIASKRYQIVNFPTVDVKITEGFEDDDFTDWYDQKLRSILERLGDAAFGVEYAGDLSEYIYGDLGILREAGYDGSDAFVTRLHGYIKPRSMDQDIRFEPVPASQARQKLLVRVIYGGEVHEAVMTVPWDLLLFIFLGVALVRRLTGRRPR